MRKVKITINSVSYDDKNSQVFEGTTNDDREFHFQDGENKYKLIVNDEEIVYSSKGRSRIELVFAPKQIHNCSYVTPYGHIPMKIKTTALYVNRGASVKLMIHYIMDIDNDKVFWSKEIIIDYLN